MKRGFALALLAAACGGEVEHEREAAPLCHEVRGYFGDQRCSQSVVFDRCDAPAYAYAVIDFTCTLVRDP
jgi:hypothetical protein